MIELVRTIPEVSAVLALEPEELAAKLLFLTRQREGGKQFHPGNFSSELFPSPGRHEGYNRDRQLEIELAYAEAWAWLEAQALVIPAPGMNGQHGWRFLSRRARRFENEKEFSGFAAASLLPKSILHPSISERVWLAFARGEYDGAVFTAMKQVEVSVRRACGFTNDELGEKLMRRAFHTENGPLTDLNTLEAERVARQNLFASAIGCYKNPQSHRDVNLEDPREAIEVIVLASHLLWIVEARLSPMSQK